MIVQRIRWPTPSRPEGRPDADGVIMPTGEADRIRILLTLTLIKAVAQLVKNDFIPALGRQGLVGLPHRHLRCQGEEPSC